MIGYTEKTDGQIAVSTTGTRHFVKTGVAWGLCVILGAGFISVRAADNPAQAAARLALEQKLYELDHMQTPAPAAVASSAIVAKSAAIGTVSTKAETLQTQAAPIAPAATSVAAPATAAPAAVASAAIAPARVAPARAILIAGLLIVSLLTVSSLIVSLLLLKLRQQNSRV